MTKQEAIHAAQEMAAICRISWCILAQVDDVDGFRYYYAPTTQFDRHKDKYAVYGFMKCGILGRNGIYRPLKWDKYDA